MYRLLGRNAERYPLTELERAIFMRCLEETLPKDPITERIAESLE